MKLSIVTPTYNESANIGEFVRQVCAALEGFDFEIIVADDDSPDQTWLAAQQLSESGAPIRVLRRKSNRGLGPSVMDGFSIAAGEYVACIDADLQHDPAIFPRMIAAMESGADLALGSRYVDGGSVGQWNAVRRAASRFATLVARTMIGTRLHDPMSGFFMMRRRDFESVKPDLDPQGFKILLEIVAQLRPKRVEEIAFTFRPRVAGESKLSPLVVSQYLAQSLRLYLAKQLARAGRATPQPEAVAVGVRGN